MSEEKCICNEPYDTERHEGGYPRCPVHDKAPTFYELVAIIEKNFRAAMLQSRAFTSDEIEAGWQRYKRLNHLWQDEQPQQSEVWVKATERLPGVRTEVKWRIDGKEWEMKETPLGMWYNKPNDFNKYEWLDESGTAAAGREESDAVKFAEWVRETYQPDEFSLWIDHAGNQYTTAELYTKFKQQKINKQ